MYSMHKGVIQQYLKSIHCLRKPKVIKLLIWRIEAHTWKEFELRQYLKGIHPLVHVLLENHLMNTNAIKWWRRTSRINLDPRTYVSHVEQHRGLAISTHDTNNTLARNVELCIHRVTSYNSIKRESGQPLCENREDYIWCMIPEKQLKTCGATALAYT